MEELKQLEKEIRILWHLDYWDGVRSGVALYDGDIVYFNLMAEYDFKPIDPNDEDSDIDWGWYRQFKVYKPSNDNKIRLMVTHAIWQAYVGLHTDYFPFSGRLIRNEEWEKTNTRQVPVLHGGPNGNFHDNWKAFEEYRKQWEEKWGKFDLKSCEPIGWVYYDQLFPKNNEKEE